MFECHEFINADHPDVFTAQKLRRTFYCADRSTCAQRRKCDYDWLPYQRVDSGVCVSGDSGVQ